MLKDKDEMCLNKINERVRVRDGIKRANAIDDDDGDEVSSSAKPKRAFLASLVELFSSLFQVFR